MAISAFNICHDFHMKQFITVLANVNVCTCRASILHCASISKLIR